MNSMLLKMEKVKILFWVDVGMFFSFLPSAISGLLLWLSLPKGQGLRYTWRIIHNWSSLIFVILVVIHLVLHWQWIKSSVKKIVR